MDAGYGGKDEKLELPAVGRDDERTGHALLTSPAQIVEKGGWRYRAPSRKSGSSVILTFLGDGWMAWVCDGRCLDAGYGGQDEKLECFLLSVEGMGEWRVITPNHLFLLRRAGEIYLILGRRVCSD